MGTNRSARVLAATCTAGLALLVAAPADAAANPTVNGSAFGASVSLGGQSVIPPTPKVVLPASGAMQSASAVSVPASPLLTANGLMATTSGNPTTGTSTATGKAANVQVGPSATGPSAVSADAVSATCNATPNGNTGSASILNGMAGGTMVLNATPGPNTTVTVPGVATVVTNEQINNPDGSLTVNALHVTLLQAAGPAADIIVGSATCGPNRAAPAVNAFSAAGLPLAGGLVALVGIGAITLRRRSRTAASL